MASQTIEQIRDLLSGAALSRHGWGPERKGSVEERKKAASANNVKKDKRSKWSKTVLDTEMKEWKAVTNWSRYCKGWWEAHTFPYLEGQRLFYKEDRSKLWAQITDFNTELKKRAGVLDTMRQQILDEAKDTLGDSFDPSVYPAKWTDVFSIEVREININPPEYLARENSEEYRLELQRRLADISKSMQTFEKQMFRHLSEAAQRFSGNLSQDKVRKDNLESFAQLFDRVSRMRFEGTAVFKNAMQDAQDILDGVSAEELKRSGGIRQETRQKLDDLIARYHQLQETVLKKNAEPACV